MSLALFICGCIWIFGSFIVTTKNLTSHICFRVVPFFTGSFVVYYAMKMLGWI